MTAPRYGYGRGERLLLYKNGRAESETSKGVQSRTLSHGGGGAKGRESRRTRYSQEGKGTKEVGNQNG